MPPIDKPASAQRPAPRVKSGDLLYATGTDHQYLYVMTYPNAKLVRTIGNFSPQDLRGLCSDEHGTVYVTDFGSLPSHTESQVYVFEHGATTPSRVLSAPPGIWNCAVDSVSGDLAVLTDNNDPSLAIYHGGSGLPTLYNGGGFDTGTYDDRGNLYLAARAAVPFTVFANGKFTSVKLDRRLDFAAQVQWNDGALVYTTRARGRRQSVYWITFSSPTVGHVEPAFTLDRKGKALPRFGVPDLVVENTVVGVGQRSGQLDFWKYPEGGDPKRSVSEGTGSNFLGLAFSTGGRQKTGVRRSR
jgi:hypothetical protein